MVKALPKLAIYLTDTHRVKVASASLEMGPDARMDAEDFFALRAVFGIHGHMSSGDALKAIRGTLANERK